MKKSIFKQNMAIYVVGILSIYIVAAITASDFTAVEGLKFILFEVMGIIVPGYAFVRLIRFGATSNIGEFTYAYAIGYTLNIAIYFLLMPLSLSNLIPYVVAILFLISVYLLIKKPKTNEIDLFYDDRGVLICVLFIAIVLMLRFFSILGRNLLPLDGVIPMYAPHKDTFYHMGDTIAASKGFPIMDFRWYTERFYYHYFTNIQMAVVKICTKISAYKLDGYVGVAQAPVMLVCGFYTLVYNICKKYKYIVWGLIAFLFTTGVEYTIMATYSGHIYVVPIAVDMGIAFAIITASVFVLQIDKEFDYKLFVLTMLFFAVGMGAKGPCMMTSLAGMGMVCIWYVLHKQPKKGFVYGCSFLILFFIIFFFILSNGVEALRGGSGGNGLEFGVLLKAIKGYPVWKYYDIFREHGLPKIISVVGLLIIWVIYSQPVAFISAFFVLACRLLGQKKLDVSNIVLMGPVMFGLIMVMVSWHHGASEMDFIMTTFPFAVAYTINNIDAVKLKYKDVLLGGLTVAGIILFVVELRPYFSMGVENIKNKKAYIEVSVENSVRPLEYEAYEWIRSNTDKDSVVLSDIYMQDNQKGNFIIGCLTERYNYIDGWIFTYYHEKELEDKFNVMKGVCQGEKNIDALKNEGVDYFVCNKNITDVSRLQIGDSNVAYENQDVIIYNIK